MNKDERFDKIRGALYGVAVGDALGGPLEFMSKAEIEKKHGTVKDMIGGGWLNLKPGETTDDTAMTLAVAEGILENPYHPIAAIGRRFISWYKSGPKDIGGTCAQAIRAAMMADDEQPSEHNWMLAGDAIRQQLGPHNAGNGALMRTIYPALYYPEDQGKKAIKEAWKIGHMTHRNVNSDFCIDLYISKIHQIIAGNEEQHERFKILAEEMKEAAAPTGYVMDSMNYAIRAVANHNTFDKTLTWAVNQGGDADTVGAITGGIAGALYGYNAIPERWIEALDPILKQRLDYLALRANERWIDHREYEKEQEETW